DASLAIIDKRRVRANEIQAMSLIGDVRGKDTIVVDDMIDTAGTLVQAAQVLFENGAKSVSASCTYGVFSGAAAQRLQTSSIREVICTDTIPLSPEMRAMEKIRCLSVAPLLAETIRRIRTHESVSSIFD